MNLETRVLQFISDSAVSLGNLCLCLPSLVKCLFTSKNIYHTCKVLWIKDQVPQAWSSLYSSKIPSEKSPVCDLIPTIPPKLLLQRLRLPIWIPIPQLSPCSQIRPANSRCWCNSKTLGATVWLSLVVTGQNTIKVISLLQPLLKSSIF